MKKYIIIITSLLLAVYSFGQSDRRPISDSILYFETHDEASNTDGVGIVLSYRNLYYLSGDVSFSLYQNSDGIYSLIDSSLYIGDNTSLTSGHDTIQLIASHDSLPNDTISVVINVKDADDCYFVDPDGTSGTGTYSDPNNVLPTITANTTYLIYRGAELDRGSTTITIAGLDSISFGSYGPFLGGDYGIISLTDNNIFRIYNSNNITVRDLELTTSEPTRSNPTHTGGDSSIYYYEDWAYLAYLNNYQGKSDSCVFTNNYIHSIYAGSFIGNDPPEWSTMSHDIEFNWNRCDSMPDEGLFVKNILGEINIISNWWTNINLLYEWFADDQQNADGDVIQTYNQDTTMVRNNCIDKSSTGQKFNAILDQISGISISSGTLEAGRVYEIRATETDHFYSGCQFGDVFTANGTETCDANNQARVYLNSPVTFKDNHSIAGANYHHIYRYCENFVCEGNIFYSIYGVGQIENNDNGYGVDGVYVGGGDDVNIYRYNVFINANYAIWDQNATIYNNVFYNTDHVTAGFGGWNQTLRNNAFVLGAGQEIYNNASVNSDYNLFTSEFTDMFGSGRSNIASVSGESNSITGNTDFYNDTTNWKTESTSDLIDAGVVVSLTQDLYYNPVGGSVDIGVFESNYSAPPESDTVQCDSIAGSEDSLIYSNDWQNWGYNQPLTDSLEWVAATTVVPRVDTSTGGTDFIVTHTVGAGHQVAILDMTLEDNQYVEFIKEFNGGPYTGVGLRMSGSGATLQGYIVRINNTEVQLLNMYEGSVIDTIDETTNVAVGSVVTYEISDSTIVIYDDGLAIIDTFDTDYTSGYAAIYAYGTYPNAYNRIDEFEVGNLGTAAQPIIKGYADITDVTGVGSNGAIDLTPYCGTSPYTYEWINIATTQDLENISADTFRVIITDFNGVSSDTLEFIVDSTSSGIDCDTVTFNISASIVNSKGYDGSLDVSITGGQTPYSYQWSSGATSEDLNSLIPNIYTLIVTDDNGCTGQEQFIVRYISSPKYKSLYIISGGNKLIFLRK